MAEQSQGESSPPDAPLRFAGRGVLLDIEGTTSSVRFVYDVMFPFARRELPAYLAAHWGEPDLADAAEQVARDAGHESLDTWQRATGRAPAALVLAEALRLMDGDVKATGLKLLQGLVWRSGYASGELRSHLYDDVPEAVRSWRAAGRDVRIYSSGSVEAQRLFFGHTEHGDLLPLFGGHYDTRTGAKRESESYRRIAAEFGLPGSSILFLSDVVAELDAAREAGLRTGLCLRPGNAPVEPGHGHPEIRSFAQIELDTSAE